MTNCKKTARKDEHRQHRLHRGTWQEARRELDEQDRRLDKQEKLLRMRDRQLQELIGLVSELDVDLIRSKFMLDGTRRKIADWYEKI